jgi:hypothetical protein
MVGQMEQMSKGLSAGKYMVGTWRMPQRCSTRETVKTEVCKDARLV